MFTVRIVSLRLGYNSSLQRKSRNPEANHFVNMCFRCTMYSDRMHYALCIPQLIFQNAVVRRGQRLESRCAQVKNQARRGEKKGGKDCKL